MEKEETILEEIKDQIPETYKCYKIIKKSGMPQY